MIIPKFPKGSFSASSRSFWGVYPISKLTTLQKQVFLRCPFKAAIYVFIKNHIWGILKILNIFGSNQVRGWEDKFL